MGGRTARIVIWNAEFATLRSQRGRRIRALLEDLQPDVICLTEGKQELLPESGGVIDSEPDYGYPIRQGRRKVLLWSRANWSHVDQQGHSSLPPGRFVSGTTDTSAGPLTVIGVCIPWKDAHVSTGARNRKIWEDHLAYLSGLQQIVSDTQGPFIVTGDFNQRVPRKWQPRYVFEALINTLEGRCEIATGGEIEGIDRQLIDHLAHSPELITGRIEGIRRVEPTGVHLSDHDGVQVEVGRR